MYIFIKNANINIKNIMGFIYNGWQYLTLACLLLVLTVYLRALRWKYLFHSTTTLQTSTLFQSQLIGYFTNNVLPIRIGDIIRSYVIAKKSNQKNAYYFISYYLTFLDIFLIELLSL